MKFPVVYSPKYNISAGGLEKLHPFDSQKYGRVVRCLTDANLLKEDEFTEPLPVTKEQLESVHTVTYLESLQSSFSCAMITEVPIVALLPNFLVRSRVLVPMQYATGGSIEAALLAFKYGWAINLGGGFHHASANKGGGFCVYADITIAIQEARARQGISRVMIVDLDAHQGNGHENDFLGDDDVFILDAYNPHIYPGDTPAKRAIKQTVYAPTGIKDDAYLSNVQGALRTALNRFVPELLVYNAGTDCLIGDPLGCMDISEQGIIKRDELVFEAALSRHIPICMLLSGGYQRSNAQVIANSIINLDKCFGLLERCRSMSQPEHPASSAI